MQAIRKKLNSQRGASMLMALLLMLVGIMVSAVIISAATSAAVNKRSEKEQQQAYLAVSSAAELVRDDFQSVAGRYKLVTVTTTSKDDPQDVKTTVEEHKATCALGDIINDIGEKLMGPASTNQYREIYTFSIEGYEDVTAEFIIVGGTSTSGEDIYDLTVIFTNGASSEHPCRMILTIEGKLVTEPLQNGKDEEENPFTKLTQTLEWNKAKLQKEVTG